LTLSEGAKTTTSVVLDVPDNVTIVSISAPEGAQHEGKKIGDAPHLTGPPHP
jgi:hypothetical protein